MEARLAAMTVIVPESPAVRPAFVTWMTAVPTEPPVKVALMPPPAATKSVSKTPPVLPVRLQAVAATLATKLLAASRVMANT